jgi:DUF4097 and DUF4098 domain-containing protein YvlB
MTRLVGALSCFLVFSASAGGQQGRSESGFEWSRRMADGATITIRNGDGSIHVGESTSDRVEVRATKLRGSRASANDVTFDVSESRGLVTICTLYDRQRSCGDRNRVSRSSSVRVEYTVLIPRDIHVNVSTGRGDIDVERAGSAVTASTGAGRVFVATERGPVNVSSGSGDVDIRIQSASADAVVAAVTGSGLIRVSLPSDFNGEIDAQSENGTLRSDFDITLLGRIEPRHIRGTIGRGGPHIRLQTGNGRIELRKG